jgi:hypothetical protein
MFGPIRGRSARLSHLLPLPETDDEYFDCQESHHLQGFGYDGVYLPKEVLENLQQNAERVLYFGDEKENQLCNPLPQISI